MYCSESTRKGGARSSIAVLALFAGYFAATPAKGQNPIEPLRVFPADRVVGPIDENRIVPLPAGTLHPRARAEFDAGPVPETRILSHMILVLKRDAAQEAAMAALAAAQQDPTSPQYHQWLTNESYAEHFGISANDLNSITEWLRGKGFTVDEVSPAGWRITFSGTVAQVSAAFHTQIRFYKDPTAFVTHYANATALSVPRALGPVIEDLVGLHDFLARPLARFVPRLESTTGDHYLAPADYATIYDLTPLYASGIDGTGQTIAIVGRCEIDPSVVQAFRTGMGLPANNTVVNTIASQSTLCTSGTESQSEVGEAYLDVEWAGAVARNATIELVVSSDIYSAAAYIVDGDSAPIISTSFESCEGENNVIWNSLWQLAAVKGITSLVGSGDSGAADCDAPSEVLATTGLNVNAICSSIYSICVGGTEFNDAGNPGLYWSSLGAALEYIPEVAWNESALNGGSGLWSSGGGYSLFWSRPSWQTGNTNPMRGIPDVSMAAAEHDGYVVCEDASCPLSGFYASSGTSAATPSFAGIMSLIVQKMGQSQGNAGPGLYSIAARTGGAVFHDIVTGNNSVTGQTGYSAGPGWDPVTGLGSVDASALVNAWAAAPGVLLSKTSVAFGNQPTGSTSASQTVTLTNPGFGPLTISSIKLTGTNAADFTSTTTCPQIPTAGTVATGADCIFTVSFKPSATGSRTAGIAITDNASGSSQSISLSGTGTSAAVLPSITTLSPTAVTPGSGAFLLTVTGTGFVQADTVSWNGAVLPTIFVSATQLTVSVGASLVAAPGAASIVVNAGGLKSNTVSFTITQGAAGLYYTAITPCHLVDTTGAPGLTGVFGPPTLAAGQTRTFQPSNGICSGIPSTALAYSLNVTVKPTNILGFLTIWPAGQTMPQVSTLNAWLGGTVSNSAIVPAGTAGGVNVFVTDQTDVAVDILGYFASTLTSNATAFYALSPCRVVDTRNAAGLLGGPQLIAGQARTFPIADSSCLPASAGATAYSLNATVVPAAPLSYIEIWPSGTAQPADVVTLGSPSGAVTADAAIVEGGAGSGAAAVYSSDPTDLVLDINGYFASPGKNGALLFHPLTPCRIADTRNQAGVFGGPALQAGTSRSFPVPSSSCNVPTGALAYSLNATVVPSGPLGYITLWPTGQQQPFVSTLNDVNGVTLANAAIVEAGTNGSISVFATNNTDLVLDINGYFAGN